MPIVDIHKDKYSIEVKDRTFIVKESEISAEPIRKKEMATFSYSHS